MTAARQSGSAVNWASHAVVHVHPMAPWWTEIHGSSRRRRARGDGKIVRLPAPVAGYRIRHDAAGSVVEIKPRNAEAVAIGRCPNAAAARQLLAWVSADHHRPFLGEIDEVAA